MAKVGDIVRFLNDVGGGRILSIKDNVAWVDNDGFETPVLLKECVVVSSGDTVPAPQPSNVKNAPGFRQVVVEDAPEEEVWEEIAGRDSLNVVLGFEPVDRPHFSTTDFDASLINDSNYFLYFSLLSRESERPEWTVRYAGMVEPNTELWLGTFERNMVVTFDRVCLQYIAFKRGKEFEMKSPGSIELKLDTTKFFKLHCFQSNPYFEKDVLALTFVKNDMDAGRKEPTSEQIKRLTDSIDKGKIREQQDEERRKQHKFSQSKNADPKEPLVVDLHINNLVDSIAGMSKADMLNHQIDTFRQIMDENLKKFGRKIIFIHGKGEGVLRQAIYKELNHRYKGFPFEDASFAQYGFGATQVTIKQHPDKFKHKKL